jgi:hypothetical protein
MLRGRHCRLLQGLGAGAGWAGLEGRHVKGTRVVAVGDPGRSDVAFPKQGFEFGESACERSGSGARWAKEIELIVVGRAAFGFEGQVRDCGLWGMRLERVRDESHETAQVEGGGRRSDVPGVAPAVFQLERENQISAGQVTRFEAVQQAGEHALEDKVQGLEAIDHVFEVDGFEQVRGGRYGEWAIALVASSEFDQV